MTRNDFKINLYESYVAQMGINLATPASAVRCATDSAMVSGFKFVPTVQCWTKSMEKLKTGYGEKKKKKACICLTTNH